MTIVDRFLEVDRWPTCRKTMLLAMFGLPAHIVAAFITWVGMRESGIVNMVLLAYVLASGVLALAVVLLCSWLVWRAGQEGAWTADLIGVLYGAFVVLIIYMMGAWSSPCFALIPLGQLLLTLWFGRRIPWVGIVMVLIMPGVVGVLGALHIIPYAPILLDDRISAQHTLGWVVGTFVPIMTFYAFCFVASLFMVAARRLAEDQVREQRLQLERSNKLIRAYVPAQVAQQIMSSVSEAPMPHERRKLTLFFSDLVGFTEIAEAMEPEDLSRILNEYFTEMTRIAHRHGGTVDELSGDAILVFFGAPQASTDTEHALAAVRMAIEMQEAVGTLNAKWEEAGIAERLSVRMGVNTGVVTIGSFGSPERMKYAALGKHVNLAARLQTSCNPGRVLMSYATWLLVRDQIACVPKGEIQLKGVRGPVAAYEVA